MGWRKYFLVARLSMREASAYRVNHVVSFIVVAAPLIIVLLLWETIYDQQQKIAGLTRSQVLTYFILTRWLFELTGPAVWWEITSDIRDGTLAAHLLRPEDYQAYQFASIIGAKLPYAVVGLIVIFPFALFIGEAFLIPDSGLVWGGFLLSIALAMMMGYLFTYLFSLTAFWLEEGRGVELLADIAIPFAMGSMLPLSFLPDAWEKFLSYLPFQYLLYFPVNIYLEKLTREQVLLGLAVQIIWIGALLLINKVVWDMGLRRFSAVGG